MGLFDAIMKLTDPDEVNKVLDGVEKAVNNVVVKGEKLADASETFGQKVESAAVKASKAIDTVDKKLS